MSIVQMGYLVNFSEKTSFVFKHHPGDNFTERKDILCSREYLAQMILDSNYLVWDAHCLNIHDYQINNSDQEMEVRGF